MNLCLCSLGLPPYFLQMFTIFIVLYYLLNLWMNECLPDNMIWVCSVLRNYALDEIPIRVGHQCASRQIEVRFCGYFLPMILTFEVVGIRIETIFLGLVLSCFKGHHSCSCYFPLITSVFMLTGYRIRPWVKISARGQFLEIKHHGWISFVDICIFCLSQLRF